MISSLDPDMSASELIRLETGSQIPEALIELAGNRKWESAICSGIGGVSDVTLAYYDLSKKEYLEINVEGIVELITLNGSLTLLNEKPFWHLHALVADRTGKTHGGHLVSCKVALTVELAVWPIDRVITRTLDESTGLRLLNG